MEKSPLNGMSLSRASIVGAGLAVVGIILFVVFWVVLGQLGVTSLARLLVSLCLPPAVIGGIIAAYALAAKSRNG